MTYTTVTLNVYHLYSTGLISSTDSVTELQNSVKKRQLLSSATDNEKQREREVWSWAKFGF